MTGPVEFTCIDCGERVAIWGNVHDNDQHICVGCMWIRNVVAKVDDPGEKERLRTTLRSMMRLNRGDP